MLKLSCLTTFLLSLNLTAQEVVIHNARNYKFISHIDNPMYVMVEGYRCKSITIKTDNGTVEKIGCYFNFKPEHFGIANIEVFANKNGKKTLIEKRMLEIDSFPPPIAGIGPFGTKERAVSLKKFQVQMGVGANADYRLDFELSCLVESFYFTIIRNDSTIFSRKNIGNLFSAETKNTIQNLRRGDIVLVSQINCLFPDKSTAYAEPLEYLMSE
jgi:hypothetical protein